MAKSVPYSERKFDRANQIQYNTDYQKDHYDRLSILLPKGYREKVKAAAEREGLSNAQYIKKLIDENT